MNHHSELPTKPILSLCMIVKNEKDNLPQCLASAKPYVDEIIVVDTGSEDGTPEIAAKYGAKVSYFEWCDDFAAARNYAISQASGDWILVLDADEELIVSSYETVRLLCQRGLEWCPNYPPLNYLTGASLRALGFSLGAIAYFQNSIHLGRDNSYYKGEPFELSYITIYPSYDMGCIYLDQNCPQDALNSFELALSFDPNFLAARKKIDQIKQM